MLHIVLSMENAKAAYPTHTTTKLSDGRRHDQWRDEVLGIG